MTSAEYTKQASDLLDAVSLMERGAACEANTIAEAQAQALTAIALELAAIREIYGGRGAP